MKQRSGFTLVELSIVLVIIGLLIGGILAAQSMISTAKINAQVQQIGQFDAMVLNFKTKFNYLPGDAPAFGGDGDGVIDISAACGGADNHTTAFACEIANFWHDLEPNLFAGSACACGPGVPVATTGSAKNVPLAKAGAPGAYVVALPMTSDGGVADLANKQNFYTILSASQNTTVLVGWYRATQTTSENSAVASAEMLAIDTKLDDALADSGFITSGALGPSPYCGGGNCVGITNLPPPTCSFGASYIVSNSGYECTPLIRIGGSVGIPQ